MLRKLEPAQITAHWDEIKEHLRVGLLPFVAVDEEHLTTILESMIAGMMEVWVLFDEKTFDLLAIATTSFIWDPVALTKNLLLYSLSGYKTIALQYWEEVKQHFYNYAKEAHCNNVIAYSTVPGVIALAQREGANTQTHLLQWRITE